MLVFLWYLGSSHLRIQSHSHKRKTRGAKHEEDFEKFTLTSVCLTSCSSVLLASWNRWFWALMKQFWQYPSSIVLPRVPQSRRWQDTLLRKVAAEVPSWPAAKVFLWDLLWWCSKVLSVMQSKDRRSLNAPSRSDGPKQLQKAPPNNNIKKNNLPASKMGFGQSWDPSVDALSSVLHKQGS